MKWYVAVFVIIGSFIGAGFATGKEIFVFFGKYGFVGIATLILSSIVMYFVIYKYQKLGKLSNGNLTYNNTRHPRILELIMLFCYFVVTSALFAGVNEFDKYLNINLNINLIGSITFVIIILLSVGGIKSLSKVSLILVPTIIIVYLIICLMYLCGDKLKFADISFSNNILQGGLNAVSYVGVNTVLSTQLLYTIGNESKEIKKISIVTCILFSLMLFVGLICLIFSDYTHLISSMPLLSIAFETNKYLGYIYIVIMWFAIVTSILSVVYSAFVMLKKYFKHNKITLILFILVSFLLSFIGFGNMVEFIYPIIGIFGVVHFLMLYISNKRGTKFINIYKSK